MRTTVCTFIHVVGRNFDTYNMKGQYSMVTCIQHVKLESKCARHIPIIKLSLTKVTQQLHWVLPSYSIDAMT